MPSRAGDACDAHMSTYRNHLRIINRCLAEEYVREHGHHVSMAINELAKAAPVALAVRQLHEAIRRSPARNFWPVIRETKGVLLVRSTDIGHECPWPWQRTNAGNMRYDLPGHLLFSPWPPNVRRRVRNRTIELERMLGVIQSMPDIDNFRFHALPSLIFYKTRQAKWLVEEIKTLQGIAMPDSIAALDRWSDEPRHGSDIVLRISRWALVYHNGPDRCEIEIPAALTKLLWRPFDARPPVRTAFGSGRSAILLPLSDSPLLMLWTAPPPARECHGCGRC
jgi:hypothetical protein